MKKIFVIVIKTILIISVTVMVNCSDSDNQETSLKKCENSEFIHTIGSSIPVTIKMVENMENSYEGSKIYYELDVETYIPEILERVDDRKTIRLFPLNHINNSVGSQIMINGKIFSCPIGGKDFLPNIYLGVNYVLEQ